ncbi:MAG TPA: hypothetical protein VLT35_07890 [Methanocella sp.]|nr:hypothetical protein [Methanocella sp.]
MTRKIDRGDRVPEREEIKAFVQDVLGCGCAEEVFQVIELRRETMEGKPYDRINIGNRLLVYVFHTDDARWAEVTLARLVRAGKEERDALGFNRFRLVLATGRPAAMGAATKAFGRLPPVDDRTYLHVVRGQQITFGTRPASGKRGTAGGKG